MPDRFRILGPHFLTYSFGSGWGGAVRTNDMPRFDAYCHTGKNGRRGLHQTETAAQECSARALAVAEAKAAARV